MAATYAGLNRAQLSFEYLHTNSTTHEFLFGALAELVDNARDAGASRMDIYSIADDSLRGGFLLCFQDDGEGMDPTEAANIITFGRSAKRTADSNLIGQYGNGLKSGSMRVGNDVILFTKKNSTMTCLMLSRTFHEEEKIEEVIVPIPSFLVQNREPVLGKGVRALERHKLEMQLILKYSPFHTEEQLFSQFRRLMGDTGTMVVIYNMKLLDSGDPELDVTTDKHDILLSGIELHEDNSKHRLVPERQSFRAYVAILYSEPRMKVYIQNKKVQSRKCVHGLYKPRFYQFTSARFKTRSKEESKKADMDAKFAAMKVREAESKARQLEKQFGSTPTSKEGRAKLRKAQQDAEELSEESKCKEQIAEKKRKALKEPKTLKFIFGLNLENRNRDGVFVYNCSRLIKMYEKVGPQLDDGLIGFGVVGIVDIPYIVLEPTHNKQDFADAKEYRHLLKAFGDHLEQYWRDLTIGPQSLADFWDSFGYATGNSPDEPPSNEAKFTRKRAMQTSLYMQCDVCLRWRMLPFSVSNIGKKFPDSWVCSMNPDTAHNRCSVPEEKISIPEGRLQKVMKTQAEKKDELAEEMRRLEEKMKRVEEKDMVESSKDVDEVMTRVASRRKSIPTTYSRSYSSPKSAKKLQRPSTNSRLSRRAVDDVSEEEDGEVVARQREEEMETDIITEELAKATGEMAAQPKSPGDEDEAESPPCKRMRRHRSQSSLEEGESEEEVVEEGAEPGRKRKSSLSTEDLEEGDLWPDASGSDGETGPKKCKPLLPRALFTAGELGSKVEVRVKKRWYKAMVIDVNYGDSEVKVKFDKFPDDKYDKTLAVDSPDLRLYQQQQMPQSPADSRSSRDTIQELPTSSTSAGPSQPSAQLLDEISKGYRTCLHYFLPPQWRMDKEVVNGLSNDELAAFPLDDFFDHYEKGLRKLVSGFQTEAAAMKDEAEKAKSSLQHTSRLIARLLNSIHEECNLDPDKDLHKVDELLLACVQQAEMTEAKSEEIVPASSE